MTNKRVPKRRLEELLMTLNRVRSHLESYREKGDAAGVERCERALKIEHALIRSHCTKHGLDLPHDVPSEDAE